MSFGRRVLVTGAGGFIGSHLAERLVALGADTVAFVRYTSSGSWGWLDRSPYRRDIEVMVGDVRDPDTLGRAMRNIDTVFHLAALIGIPYSYHAPISYVRTNVEGTANVLQTALNSGVSLVVHTSTSEVYGTARYVPMDEAHPLQGQSPYSATKIAADKIAEAFHLSFNLPIATIRPFNTYGPRQSARAIIPTIIIQALTRPTLTLGNLDPTRDLTYVEDTVDGFIKISEQPAAIGQVINVGSGQDISVKDLVATILQLMGKDLPISQDDQRARPIGSEVERLCADTSKAQRLLDWRSRTDLAQGLGKTIEWVQTNLELYKADRYAV